MHDTNTFLTPSIERASSIPRISRTVPLPGMIALSTENRLIVFVRFPGGSPRAIFIAAMIRLMPVE